MNRDQVWLTDAQFPKIEPHLPTDTHGKARVDDRRVIGGIVHVLKSGGRWVGYEDRREVDRILVSRLALGIGRAVWSDVEITH